MNTWSEILASNLSDEYYEMAMEREPGRLSEAINEYIEAMREEALKLDGSGDHDGLDPVDFMRSLHDNIGQLFYDL